MASQLSPLSLLPAVVLLVLLLCSPFSRSAQKNGAIVENSCVPLQIIVGFAWMLLLHPTSVIFLVWFLSVPTHCHHSHHEHAAMSAKTESDGKQDAKPTQGRGAIFLLLGGTASMMAATCTHPLDLLKVQFERERLSVYPTFYACFCSCLRVCMCVHVCVCMCVCVCVCVCV